MKVKFTKTRESKNYWRFEPQFSLVKGSVYIPKKWLDKNVQVIEVNMAVESEEIQQKNPELFQVIA